VPTLPHEEFEIRRIILLRLSRCEHAEILLGSEVSCFTLPQIRIARWQRIAEQLTTAFRKAFGIEAISVSSVDGRFTEAGLEQIAYEIMEPHGVQDEAPCHKRWVAVDSLVESGFHERTDFHAIRQAVAQSIPGEGASRGPFARLGWFQELEDWVQEEIGRQGLQLSGSFRQLNASPSFSLIRFETEGPAVWFKAVGCPNLREFPLALALSRFFPRFLPRIIAERPECNGWLAFETKGPLLTGCSALSSWHGAAEDLSELQMQSSGTAGHLLEAGARDMRAPSLAALVGPYFCGICEVMEQQTKIPPEPLSREALQYLSVRVRHAVGLIDETGFPATLGNFDINPANIVCNPGGCVFLDWAEAFVGHPFFTLQYFLEHFRRAFGKDRSQDAQLIHRYCAPWRISASLSDVERALEFSPLVAAFSAAARSDAWKSANNLLEPRTAGYLRGLTRRMDREARLLPERRLSWTS
jgi:hypothetical protein